jgi:hypothetical protein
MNSATTPVWKMFHDYAGTNVGTTSWVALTRTSEDHANRLEIFDSGGQLMEIGYGPSASETSVFYIMPGGNGVVDIIVPDGTSVSVRGVDGAASSGVLAVNAFK